MANRRRPKLSQPFEMAIGPASPVQRALKLLRAIIRQTPMPEAHSEAARSATTLLGVHMLHLLEGAGQLNGAGYHSASVILFRPLEDTLDCFAAVGLIAGAAEKWLDRELKPSEAAKMWAQEAVGFEHESMSLSDYRKTLRSQFNEYSHCSPALTDWNLFFTPLTGDKGNLDLNFEPLVIDANAHRIDAHLTAHLWEFIDIVEQVFEEYLQNDEAVHAELTTLEREIEIILKRHKDHGCFDVLGAAELERLGFLPQLKHDG